MFTPVTEANTFVQNVTFPSGSNWYSFFNPNLTYQGGNTYSVEVPLTSAAAFAKQSSILPLHVSTGMLHNGD
jgi:alpha-glucosidase (family GH31 glycosyl hydrolase)